MYVRKGHEPMRSDVLLSGVPITQGTFMHAQNTISLHEYRAAIGHPSFLFQRKNAAKDPIV